MIKINKFNTEINEFQIRAFEDEIGKRLPNDYCDFLLKYNGGTTENNIYEISEISISVDYFCGLGLTGIQDIKYIIEVLENRIPKECIPIAELEGGDVLCLELSEQN